MLAVMLLLTLSNCGRKARDGLKDTVAKTENLEETTDLKTVSVLVDLVDDAPAEAITKTLNKVPGFGEEFMYQLEILPTSFNAQERDIAITRNARYPDEAFRIIDYLLDPEVQQTSNIFQYCVQGLPIYTGTGSSDTPSGSCWQMNETNFKAITEMQEQINAANFPGPVDANLWTVQWYDEEARKNLSMRSMF